MTQSFDPRWEAEHRHREWGADPDRQFQRFVLEEYGPFISQPLRALDLGCGVGAQGFFLASRGFSVIGVDASPSAIWRATLKGAEAKYPPARLAFMVADAVHLPFADESFDFIVDVCCLQELDIQCARQAVAELRRVIRRSGQMYSKHLVDSVRLTGPLWQHGDKPQSRCLGADDINFFHGFSGESWIMETTNERGDVMRYAFTKGAPC